MITVILALMLTLISIGLIHLYILLLAGGKRVALSDDPQHWLHLAIIIPAHNEETVIGASVRQLLQCDYPHDAFDVHVVADYCTDGTAAVAASAGAIAHPRDEGPRGRKGYAVGWLIQQILAGPKIYDAIVVFDADSRADPMFLQYINKALNSGIRVIQGQHIISNPAASTFSALADVDMRLNNRIRNQAKANLGLSARLMGDAMCFHRCILEAHPWTQASSLAEDREYGIYLVTQGICTNYVAAAISAGQATTRWKDANPQRLRWYGGVFELQRRYIRPLLITAWRNKSLAAFDFALELLLPPFSTLVVLAILATTIASLFATVQLTSWIMAAVAACLMLLTVVYPIIGLAVEHAPTSTYRALLYGPAYALWRFGVGLRATIRRGNVLWIRTRRTEEIETK